MYLNFLKRLYNSLIVLKFELKKIRVILFSNFYQLLLTNLLFCRILI